MLKKFTEAASYILENKFEQIPKEFTNDNLVFKTELAPNGIKIFFDVFEKSKEEPIANLTVTTFAPRKAVMSALSDFTKLKQGKEILQVIFKKLAENNFEFIDALIGKTDKTTRDFAFDLGFEEVNNGLESNISDMFTLSL